MGYVTIVFTRRRAIGSALLRAWMHSRFSHCALVDRNTGTIIEAALSGGVRERPLAALLDEASYHEFVRIPARDPASVLASARAQIGKPYDWRGVLGFWLRRDWQDSDAFLCSELVAFALHDAGQPAFRREAWRVSPENLYLPRFDR